jgi:hypothetical protein
MLFLRRVAFLLAIGLPALHVLQAQDSSSSSTPAASTPAAQDQTQQATPAESQGQLSVQARIKARREQRRAQAIRDTYGHLYEAYVGGGYLRTTPGPSLQKITMYSWNAALTRYYGEKLGATADFRGYYGTAFVGLNESAVTRPAISEYTFMGGPTYRFFRRPKYSLAAHVLGGAALGNFTSDTNGFGSIPNPVGSGELLYPDSTTYAFSGGVFGEMNISPNLSLRLAGEYVGTGFGSQLQNGVGFNYGFVYRFGKQQ